MNGGGHKKISKQIQ